MQPTKTKKCRSYRIEWVALVDISDEMFYEWREQRNIGNRTSPNCQRNKIFCYNFRTRRDSKKLWIFWFYTVIFMSVYAIVMVGRDSLSTESRVQNPTKQCECYGMAIEISRLVAARTGMGPAWQTCVPTPSPATDVASPSAGVSARMEQHSNECDSAVFTLNETTLPRCDSIGMGATQGSELC